MALLHIAQPYGSPFLLGGFLCSCWPGYVAGGVGLRVSLMRGVYLPRLPFHLFLFQISRFPQTDAELKAALLQRRLPVAGSQSSPLCLFVNHQPFPASS